MKKEAKPMLSTPKTFPIVLCLSLSALPFFISGCGGGNSACPTSVTPADQTMALSRLARLSQAVGLYVQDYDQVFPIAKNQSSMQLLLFPYTKDSTAFVNPNTNIPFEFNYSISGMSLAAVNISDSYQFIYVYDPKPADSAMRGVGLADFKSKLVTEAQWQQLKATSKIP